MPVSQCSTDVRQRPRGAIGVASGCSTRTPALWSRIPTPGLESASQRNTVPNHRALVCAWPAGSQTIEVRPLRGERAERRSNARKQQLAVSRTDLLDCCDYHGERINGSPCRGADLSRLEFGRRGGAISLIVFACARWMDVGDDGRYVFPKGSRENLQVDGELVLGGGAEGG